jgi:hypothetical protein
MTIMGFLRLRGRLDQVQGRANETLGMAQDLIADLQDGFGVKVEFDLTKTAELLNHLMVGKLPGKFELPLTIKVDPTVDVKQ